jgi:hypothetical protein
MRGYVVWKHVLRHVKLSAWRNMILSSKRIYWYTYPVTKASLRITLYMRLEFPSTVRHVLIG